MINARDLRIGNFIFDDDGIIAKIIGFKPYEHSIRCDEDEGCDILVDLFPQDGEVRQGFAVESKLANPIPLTSEWLERCGFKSVLEYFDLNTEFGCIRYNNDSVSLFVGSEYQLTVSMDYDTMQLPGKYNYLHQLQNLYHALTGEELKIEL